MIKNDIKILTKLNSKNILFKDVIEKLTIDADLNYEEKSYILALAILLIEYYQDNKRYTNFADLSYYIILKYSLNFNDYVPLYDYSINFGFYPISKAILNHELANRGVINDCFIDLKLEKFKNYNKDYETLEQYLGTKNFLSDTSDEKSYLAPTSFGKSSLVVEYIKKLNNNLSIVIVVPTKSLLMQTYQMIRKSNLGKKIIIHDEMYNNEKSIVAVFTQERALRLLRRKDFAFDIIVIDEAHNLLKEDKSGRSILLSRLIAKNRNKNPKQQVVYLSPLIDNIDNIKIYKDQDISSHVVNFNIKEPEIFEYKIDKNVFKYNRFVNEFYKIDTGVEMFDYLKTNSGEKNFIYNYRPIKIEKLASDLYDYLPKIKMTNHVIEIEKILKKEIHEDFYGIKYLQCGLIYLHAKLPDLIKEYLEFKFKTLKELKYVIANSVILEGMNLPVDTLFIFNTYSLRGKELMNLIGRVNRLNDIFNKETIDLNKLLPKIHFINNIEHEKTKSNMESKIRLLRNRVFDDVVENPTLNSFDIGKIKKGNKEDYLKKIELIQTNEKFIYSNPKSEEDSVLLYLIESGINNYYFNTDSFINNFIKKLKEIKDNIIANWGELNMIDKIYNVFIIDNIKNISDLEIKRLNDGKARNYYENYITIGQKQSLNERINSQFDYFKKRILSGDNQLYFGTSYGEEFYESGEYSDPSKRAYVNLANKKDNELINLAIVKLKMEDDFISFDLNKFIVMMFDFQIITEDEYNKYIYGTTEKHKIDLTKYGLSLNLISRLEKDGQLNNISFDEFNNLVGNSDFDIFINSINDFYRFEISRYLN